MKPVVLLLLVFLSAIQLISAQVTGCTKTEVEVNNGLEIKGGQLALPGKNVSLVFTIKQNKECSITVTAYKEMQMTMSVNKYSLQEGCQNSYLKAAVEAQGQDIQVCSEKDKGASLTSKEKVLYLTVKPSAALGSFELNFMSIQGKECGQSEIVLAEKKQTVRFPMDTSGFTRLSECDILVTRKPPRAFQMNITKINIHATDCSNNYIVASTDVITDAQKLEKKCKVSDVGYQVSAPDGKLFLKILTQDPIAGAEVTLDFETDYSECGPSEIEIPQEGREITLPAAGKQFKSDTTCEIKAFGKNGTNFVMTIPKIEFYAASCDNDYVSASTDLKLPNTTYKKCGMNPVNDPFESANGVMYLQVKTQNANQDKMVNIKFQSSARKLGPYAITAISLITLLPSILC